MIKILAYNWGQNNVTRFFIASFASKKYQT